MKENYIDKPLPVENAENEIDKLKEKISSLESENEELKKSKKSAYELVSIATHQIRGPLTAISGYEACIMEGDYGEVPEKMKTPLNIISKSAKTLSRTVNDFLDISKIEQGEMRFYLKEFNLADLVKEVTEEMKLGIESDGLELRTNIEEGSFMIYNDKTKLKHVLINLIDNAHKYAKSGWIEVGLHGGESGKIILSVKDSGMGIDEATIPNLFKKFSRAPEASKVNSRGTGIGLYIAKRIIEARHGRIWVESEGKGRGSEFYVELEGI